MADRVIHHEFVAAPPRMEALPRAVEKPLSATISELKNEVSAFVQTRYEMLRAEMKPKLTALKLVAPLAAMIVAFAAVGLLCFTGLVIVLIAVAIGGLSGWAWAFFIVGALYFLVAGACFLMARGQVKRTSLAPKKTLQVLKQDQVWLQSEARSA